MKVVSMLEQSRSVCAKAYLKRDLFTDYKLNKAALPPPPPGAAIRATDDYSLICSLTHLIDCLQLFGTPGGKEGSSRAAATVLHFSVQAPDHPFIIRFVSAAHERSEPQAHLCENTDVAIS
jgi:hypothetical protein